MNNNIMKITSLIATLLIIGNAQAASFDCNKANLETEKIVCSTPELSSMDEKLADLYFSVKSKSSDQDKIKAAQINWIAALRKCPDANCIKVLYQNRYTELSTINQALAPLVAQSTTRDNNIKSESPTEIQNTNPTSQISEPSSPQLVSSAPKIIPTENSNTNLEIYKTPALPSEQSTYFWTIPSDLIVFFNVTILILILITPIIPAIILERKIENSSTIVFVHHSEMMAYFTSGIIMIFGGLLFYFSESIAMRFISGLFIATGIFTFVALYGFQKASTRQSDSALTLYLLKIFFIGFGSLISAIFYFVASLFAQLAYDDAKKGKVARAVVNGATAYGSYKAAENAKSSFFGKNSKYINGQNYEDISIIFPNKGIIDVFSSGWINFKAGKKCATLDILLDQLHSNKTSLNQPSNRF